MKLGEKIKQYRRRKGLSQEQLAEMINVSRQAITKWERDGGIPELNNLIALSEVFEVSIDELIEKQNGISEKNGQCYDYVDGDNFVAEYYDIELSGWNDGEYDVLLVGQDQDFIYFMKQVKSTQIAGLIGKRYVTRATKLNKAVNQIDEIRKITRSYFRGKIVDIELAKKEGMIAGFFDFRDDDYQETKIEAILEDRIMLEFGRSLPIRQITKIQEVYPK